MPLLKCTGNHLVYMEKDNNIPFAIFVRAGFIGYINEFILVIDIAKLTELRDNGLLWRVFAGYNSVQIEKGSKILIESASY